MSRKLSAVAPRGVLVLVLLLAATVRAQELPWHSPAKQLPVVAYQYPEQIQLAAGKPAEVDLHFQIREGFHINSHAPRDGTLLRTELMVVEPAGVDVEGVQFPPGAQYGSKVFPGQLLSVYTGELVLHARLLAARPGTQELQAVLRYQACDADACFPPREAPVVLSLVVR